MDYLKNNRLKVLRIYGVNNGICGCQNRGCRAVGKHPAIQPDGKNMGVHSAGEFYDPKDFENYNLAIATGRGLLVVDIDPRNGGHLTFHELSNGNKSPDTWTVATGGGGTHIYFRVPLDLPIKSTSWEGVDFQYSGKYVIAPPSTHMSNNKYHWVDCDPETDPIAECPKWLIDWIMNRQHAIEETIAPKGHIGAIAPVFEEWEWISTILEKLSPDIGYSNWLAVGMGLHATDDQRALTIWRDWSAKDEKKFVPGECERKWKSFSASRGIGDCHTYRYIFALADMYGIEYGKDNNHIFENWNKPEYSTPDAGYDKKIESLLNDSGPILKELTDVSLSNSKVMIKSFALASAIQIVSACAQGSYTAPRNGSLNLYQWCVAPAGSGKNSYVKFVQKTLKSIKENLVAPEFGSVSGLRVTLKSFNSRLAIRDEFHDEYLSMVNSRNEYMKALAKDYKMLWDRPSELPMVVIKTSTTPRIEQPCFSLMAWSTESGLQACAHGDFLTSGLGSRFVFWFMTSPERNFDESEQKQITSETREALAKIYRIGETLAGKTMGTDEETTKALQSAMADPKGGKISMPLPTTIHSTIVIENEAYFNERYAADWHQLQLLHNSANGKQKDLASIYSRKFQIAIRLAAIRCLSHKREQVSDCDINWGISLIDVLLTRSVGIFQENEVVTHSDEDVMRRTEKVFNTIAKLQKQVNEPICKRDLARNIRISSKNLDEAIIRLCETEKINVLDKNLRIVKPLKIERGLRFYIADE